MSENQIPAVSRTEFGKGAARRTRRAGMVPAVLYGHGTDPVHLSLPAHELQLALRVANAVLEIAVDGGKPQLALAKQVQRHPVRPYIEHVDLVIVRKGEKVTVEVPLVIVGDHPADRRVNQDQQVISLEVEATHIPAHIEVDVAKLEIGDAITAADLVLPSGASYTGDAEDLILSMVVAQEQSTEPDLGEDAEAGEGAAEAAEDSGDEA